MRDISRRSFLVRSGAAVVAAGTGGLVAAGPAAAADHTGVLDDKIVDQGGEVFDVSFYGAAGDGTTDDTSAIQDAVDDATAVDGTVFLPPGTYLITGQIELSGKVSLVGSGTKAPGQVVPPSPGKGNTVLLCGSSSAGILVTGCGTYRDFECDGDDTGTAPVQHGKVVGGVAQATRGATFVNVWVNNSAGNGFTVYGAQDSSYHDCRAEFSADDGLLIDGGAGGLHFWHWEEANNAGYGVRGDATVDGGTGTFGDHTENVRFVSGICDGGGVVNGLGKLKLRKATNWSFPAFSIVGGTSQSGPTVDLDQSHGYGLDFSGCWIWGNSSYAGIDVKGSGPTGAGLKPQTFLVADDIQWHNSGTSITIEAAPGVNRFGARGWMFENASPAGPSGGAAGDTLLIGRQGPWATGISYQPGWLSQGITYRIDSDGMVEFKGSATASNLSASALFVLPEGYRPDHTLKLPAMHGNGASYVTVDANGTVSTPNPGLFGQVWMDGVSFPVR